MTHHASCVYGGQVCERCFVLFLQELWLSDVLKEALWNGDKLISFVGVDQAPVEPSGADTCGINRYVCSQQEAGATDSVLCHSVAPSGAHAKGM